MTDEVDYLRTAMRAQGVTQRDCARLLCLSPSNVSRRFAGRTPFDRSELAKLDSHLGLRGGLLERAGYRTAAMPSALAPPPAIDADLPPAYWISYFERHLRVLDEPKSDAVAIANVKRTHPKAKTITK